MEEVEVAPTGGAFIVEGEHDRSAVPSSGSDHFWRKGIIYFVLGDFTVILASEVWSI